MPTTVRDIVAFARPEIERAGCTVDGPGRRAVPPALFDESQLRQALLNLLRNAREAMRDGGRDRRGVAAEGMSVVIDVADRGGGISRGHPRAGLRSVLLDQGRRDGARARRSRVRSSRRTAARSTCDSREGGGTRFRLALPIAPSSRVEPARTNAARRRVGHNRVATCPCRPCPRSAPTPSARASSRRGRRRAARPRARGPGPEPGAHRALRAVAWRLIPTEPRSSSNSDSLRSAGPLRWAHPPGGRRACAPTSSASRIPPSRSTRCRSNASCPVQTRPRATASTSSFVMCRPCGDAVEERVVDPLDSCAAPARAPRR